MTNLPDKETAWQCANDAWGDLNIILRAMKAHCQDDFVVMIDGTIDWPRTIDEFVSFVQLDVKAIEQQKGGEITR